MNKLRDATLVFLIKKVNGKITDICLAMKKRGFGVNRWNGVGGKVNADLETVEDAAKRETREEIDVALNDLKKVAELEFNFPHNAAWNQMVHVYFSEKWQGEPSESEEMKPQWYKISEIPYNNMWPDDEFWIPLVLTGKLVKANFVFGEGDTIQDQKIQVVNSL